MCESQAIVEISVTALHESLSLSFSFSLLLPDLCSCTSQAIVEISVTALHESLTKYTRQVRERVCVCQREREK